MTYTLTVSMRKAFTENWLTICKLTDIPPHEIAEFVQTYNKALLPSLFDYKIVLTMEVPPNA